MDWNWDPSSNPFHDAVIMRLHLRGFHVLSLCAIDVTEPDDQRKPKRTVPDFTCLFGVACDVRAKAKLAGYIDGKVHLRRVSETRDLLLRDRLRGRGWVVQAEPYEEDTEIERERVTAVFVKHIRGMVERFGDSPQIMR